MHPKEERRNICVEAITGWHDPKLGRSYSYLAEKTDLAESYIRKLARGDGFPSEAALQLILTTIWGFDKATTTVYQIRNRTAVSQVLTSPLLLNCGAKPSTIKAENALEAEFLIRLAGSEKMSIAFAQQLLGDNYEDFLDKFVSQNDFAKIEGDFIILTCQSTEALLLQTIRQFGHFFLDRADNTRENCMVAARSESLTEEAIEKIDDEMRQAYSRIVQITTAPESKGNIVFGYTLACSVLWKKDARI